MNRDIELAAKSALMVCFVIVLFSGFSAGSGIQSDDRFEPNDEQDEATEITRGSYSNLFIEDGESDYFAIDLASGSDLTAAIGFSHDTGDLDLGVYGPSGTELADSISTSDDESVTITATQTGTYYVEVYGYSGASAPYSLELSVDDDQPNDRFEPNDNLSAAASVAPDSYTELSIEGEESDYFALNLTAGDNLTTEVGFSHTLGNLNLAVYSPSRTELDESSSTSDDESLSITASQNGTHYVEVYGHSNASVPYFLTLSVDSQQPNDRFEPNDNLSEATNVTPGGYTELSIESGESDYFEVNLTAGDDLTAELGFSHNVGDLNLAVYNSSGAEIADSTSNSDDESASITALDTGSYYIRVYGHAGDSGSYFLTLSVDRQQTTDRLEPNNQLSDATELTSNSYSNLFIDGGESDYFSLELTVEDSLTATVEFSHAIGNLDFAVYNMSGVEIENSSSTTDDESITTTASQNGTHYLEVYSRSGESVPYSLSLSTDSGEESGITVSLMYENRDANLGILLMFSVVLLTITGLTGRD